MIQIDEIKEIAKRYHEKIIEIRRHLHQYPELSFQEHETAEYIRNILDKLKISYKTIAKTGIIADIEGKSPKGKCIAIRADIDALPIQEENTFHYKSKTENVMHSCGHDAHTAMLIGTATLLLELKDKWAGRVRLIFQPAEEKIPGGALQMISEGIFNDFKPDYVIAQHVDPTIETGKIGIRPGMYMASTDEVYLKIKGTGGHAAQPNRITDTVLAASQIIVSLQQIVSRNADPTIPSVLSFGKVTANGATNIIPNEVNIEGTFRTFNENWRADAHQRIKRIATETAALYKTTCEVEILKGYPFLVNNEALAKQIKENAIAFLDNSKVEELDLRLTAEDFSYFTQRHPSVLYRVGTGNQKKGTTHPLHSSVFNIDEDALLTGMGFMTYNVLNLLDN